MLSISLAAAFVLGTMHVRGATTLLRELEQRDPLFDFPGANYEELRDVAGIIKSANLSAQASHPELTGKPVYPARFWHEVAELRAIRDRFLANPSWLRGLRLVGAEVRTARAYRHDAAGLLNLLDAARRSDRGRLAENTAFPFFPNVATDVTTIRNAMQRINENGDALNTLLRDRIRCVVLATCLTDPEVTGGSDRLAAGPELAPSSAARLPEHELSSIAGALDATPLSERLFAYGTPCFGDFTRASLFRIWSRRFAPDRAVFYPKLATDSFFRRTAVAPALHPDAIRSKSGEYYVWQPETNFYACVDLGYYPALATMSELVRIARNEPIADRLKPSLEPYDWARLRAAEYALATAPMISPTLMETYTDAISRTAMRESGHLDGAAIRAAMERLRLWRTQSGGLAGVFAQLEVDSERYARLIAPRARGASPVAFLVSRSYPSLLFAPWNESVWRLEDTPQFAIVDEEPRGAYASYWELLGQHPPVDIREIEQRSLVK